MKNKRDIKTILFDVFENMVDRGDEKLENEFDYYFYDRGDFQKKYFTEYERDRYDGDIETISILIKQLELFGEVIYEDDDGTIMNRNIDEKFLKEEMKKNSNPFRIKKVGDKYEYDFVSYDEWEKIIEDDG